MKRVLENRAHPPGVYHIWFRSFRWRSTRSGNVLYGQNALTHHSDQKSAGERAIVQATRKVERRVATRWNEEEDADVVGNSKGFDVGSTVCAQSCAYAVAVYIVAGNRGTCCLGKRQQTTATNQWKERQGPFVAVLWCVLVRRVESRSCGTKLGAG